MSLASCAQRHDLPAHRSIAGHVRVIGQACRTEFVHGPDVIQGTTRRWPRVDRCDIHKATKEPRLADDAHFSPAGGNATEVAGRRCATFHARTLVATQHGWLIVGHA